MKTKILLLIIVFTPALLFADGFALKKDKTGNVRIVVEKGTPGQTSGYGSGDDATSHDALQSDSLDRKHYIEIVNEGVALVGKGQYEEAVKKYEEAVRIDPQLPYAYIDLANAYWHLKEYKKSIAMSSLALQINPNDGRTYSNLGNAYYGLGNHKEAKENYQKAKKLFQEAGDSENLKNVEKSLALL